jgi:hypothetical protein
MKLEKSRIDVTLKSCFRKMKKFYITAFRAATNFEKKNRKDDFNRKLSEFLDSDTAAQLLGLNRYLT